MDKGLTDRQKELINIIESTHIAEGHAYYWQNQFKIVDSLKELVLTMVKDNG